MLHANIPPAQYEQQLPIISQEAINLVFPKQLTQDDERIIELVEAWEKEEK